MPTTRSVRTAEVNNAVSALLSLKTSRAQRPVQSPAPPKRKAALVARELIKLCAESEQD